MIGQSFSPTQDPTQQQAGSASNSPGGAASPLQQAIQILQLRMPHFFNASAPAPSPLLQSPGAPVGFNPMALMQHLFGGMNGGGMPPPTAPPPMAGGMGSAPPPPGSSPTPGGGVIPKIVYQPGPGGTATGPPRPEPRPGPVFGGGNMRRQ